jgi:hypothetical protein
MIKKIRGEQWRIVATLWVVSALVGILGQFFIWQGIEWWTKSYLNVAFGVIVIIATIIATAMGLRIIPPGKIDLAAALHTTLVRKSLNRRLRDMEHEGDRERVRKLLQNIFEPL